MHGDLEQAKKAMEKLQTDLEHSTREFVLLQQKQKITEAHQKEQLVQQIIGLKHEVCVKIYFSFTSRHESHLPERKKCICDCYVPSKKCITEQNFFFYQIYLLCLILYYCSV